MLDTRALSALVSAALTIVCLATAQRAVTPQTSADEASVKTFLQSHAQNDKEARYIVAFRDLNGDGTREAIAYLISNDWCGSGGCSLFILTKAGRSWRVVTRTTVTQLPVRVLSATSHGWHSISVWVQGGGIQPGYEAELPFNGRRYPGNPSASPARRAKKNSPGEEIISSTEKGKPLYGN